MLQHCLLELQLGTSIGDLCAADLDLAMGNRHVGLGDRLVALRFFRGLLRDHAPIDQGLLAAVRLLLLRRYGNRLFEIGLGFANIDLGAEQSRLGLRNFGFLLADGEACHYVSLLDPIAVISLQFDQRGTDLEANFRQHARLDGAEPEYPHRDVALDCRHLDPERPVGIDKRACRNDANECRAENEVAHDRSAQQIRNPRTHVRPRMCWDAPSPVLKGSDTAIVEASRPPA